MGRIILWHPRLEVERKIEEATEWLHCPLCDYQFNRVASRTEHIQNIHGFTIAKRNIEGLAP
jgi:uncharacterized C2H2 Zn-finger protein